MPPRRITVLAAVCLLAGLLTNLAVGVLAPLVLNAPPVEITRPFNGDGRTRSAFWSVTMVTVDEVLPDREDPREVARTYHIAADREYFKLEALPERPPRPTAPQRKWRHYNAGWPFRSFWGWSNEPTKIGGPVSGVGYMEDSDVRRGLIWLPYLVSRESYMPTQTWVPVLPLWPGLIANSLIYGLAWWALLATPIAFRRVLRRRRGQCVKCGYDCSSSGRKCPECGTTR